MMTLNEARAHLGAEVTHHATGVIEAVTDHFVWVRYNSDPTALKSVRPENVTFVVRPDELTLTDAVDGAG